MATETQTQPTAPDVTVFSRVAAIPLVSSSLETIHSTLSSNTYTKSLYPHAQSISTSAYNLTVPVQVRLAPLITRVDRVANSGLDAVENRYPYPFKAKPEEVAEYVRGQREQAHKALDERVRSPAYNVAQGIDQACISFLMMSIFKQVPVLTSLL
jgi:hypothetical protein